jgi:hypothetical protein
VHDPPRAAAIAPDVPEVLSDLLARLGILGVKARPGAAEIARVLDSLPADRQGLRVAASSRVVEWTGGAIDIGKHPSAGIVVDDRAASRFHAEIRIDGDRVLVRDLESKNGLTVNGKRVREASVGPEDEIAIGSERLKVARWIAPRLDPVSRALASDASVLIEADDAEAERIARAIEPRLTVVRATEAIPAEGSVLVLGAEALQDAPSGPRIFAATKADLRLEVNAGRFPAKLFHRLAGVRIRGGAVLS